MTKDFNVYCMLALVSIFITSKGEFNAHPHFMGLFHGKNSKNTINTDDHTPSLSVQCHQLNCYDMNIFKNNYIVI